MLLSDKLTNINKPQIPQLASNTAYSVKEFWRKVVMVNMPHRETLIGWHNLLISYIKQNNPLLAIRGYNNAPRDKYNQLRRGFLTQSNTFSYFFTDNYFAAFIAKMAIDNFVPQLDEFIHIMNNRKFPSRFGRITSEEKQLMAIKMGRDPGINSSGYKLAHIIPVGQEYLFGYQKFNIKTILDQYFPRGEREDWGSFNDANGDYYKRVLLNDDDKNNRMIATAIFLRFVHPFNYFLAPKKDMETNTKCNEIAEYKELLYYAHNWFLENYPNEYREFLSLIMADEKYNDFIPFDNELEIQCGYAYHCTKPHHVTPNPPPIVTPSSATNHTNSCINYDMVTEYLLNPKTSFRKLERQFMGIDSQARGGGFKAKSEINDAGLTAIHKGILTEKDIDSLISESTGTLKKTLITIKQMGLIK